MRNLDWMGQALCAQTDPDLFFPEEGRSYGDARKICQACPVRQQCNDHTEHLEEGSAKNSRWGAWAGQSPNARARAADGNQRRKQEAERRDAILRLHNRGMTPDAIASHVGCNIRTVWRITKQYRDQLEEAA